MGGCVFGQLKSSSWRYYLAYIRQWPWLLGTLLVAVIPFALLAALRTAAPPIHKDECHFISRTLWSGVGTGLLQSFVCTLDNPCQSLDNSSDTPYQFPGAPFNELLNASWWDGSDVIDGEITEMPKNLDTLTKLARLINNPTLNQLMEDGVRVRDMVVAPANLRANLTIDHGLQPQIVDSIFNASINVSRILSLVGYRHGSSVVCSPSLLGQFLVTGSDQVKVISEALCDLSTQQVNNITKTFVSALDPKPLFSKVEEVLEAVGGWDAKLVVHRVSKMVTSLRSLEAMAPLASALNSLSSALSPLMSSMDTLTQAGWDAESLSEMLGVISDVTQGLSTSSTPTTSPLRQASRSVALLLDPENITTTAIQQAPYDPWKEVLIEAGGAVEGAGAGLLQMAQQLRRNMPAHTTLVTLTSVAPALLTSQPINVTQLCIDLDAGMTRLLPEVANPFQQILDLMWPLTIMATNVTMATDVMVSWMLIEPRLSSSHILSIITALTNISQTQDLIREDRLDSWVCDRNMWTNVSESDWTIFEQRICSFEGRRDIKQITELINIPMNFSQWIQTHTNNTAKPSDVLKSAIDLINITQTSPHLRAIFGLSQHDAKTPWDNARKKRAAIHDLNSLLPNLPTLDGVTFGALEDGVLMSKNIIRNLTTLYLSLLREAGQTLRNYEDRPELNSLLEYLTNNNQTITEFAGLTTAVLDSIIHLTSITRQPDWTLIDLLFSDQLSHLLTTVLPADAMESVQRIFNLMEEPPVIELPPPLPQIVDILNATTNIIANITQNGDIWVWCEDRCSHVTYLISKLPTLLPRIIALPYLWASIGVNQTQLAPLLNGTAWRDYPCVGDYNTSLATLFPSSSIQLPYSWTNVQQMKDEMRQVEDYLCKNFTGVLDQLTSNEELTGSFKSLIEDLNPREVNISDLISLVTSLGKNLTPLDPHNLLDNLTSTPNVAQVIERELTQAFNVTFNTERQFRHLMDVGMELLVEMAGDGLSFKALANLSYPLDYTLYHSLQVTNALHQFLKGNVTLTSVLGIENGNGILNTDFFPLSLLNQNWTKTATFIEQEILNITWTTVLSGGMDWEKWIKGVCNRSQDTENGLVYTLCGYFFTPHHLTNTQSWPQSNLTATIINALTSYEKPDATISSVTIPELITPMASLVETLRTVDITAKLNTSVLTWLKDSITTQVDGLVIWLREAYMSWPFIVADKVVRENDEVAGILSKVYTVLKWIRPTLPHSDNFTIIPESLINLHSTLNETWQVLLAGLHHNILLNSSNVLNLTLIDLCSTTPSLQDTVWNGHSFLDAVSKLCQSLGGNTLNELNDWLKYEDLIKDLENGTVPSAKEVFGEVEWLVNWAKEFLESIKTKMEADMILPSYLNFDNWMELLNSLRGNYSSIGMGDLRQGVEVLVKWIQDWGINLNPTLKLPCLHNIIIKFITAKDLETLLNNSPTLWSVADTFMNYAPNAVSSLINITHTEPGALRKLIQNVLEMESWEGICSGQLQVDGQHFDQLLSRVCQISPEQVLGDIKSLFGIDYLLDGTNSSVVDAFNCTISAANSISHFKQNISLFSSPIEFLGLGAWEDLATMIFNTNTDNIWNGNTTVLLKIIDPLVNLSRENGSLGNSVYSVLRGAESIMRWGRFELNLIRGGDLWSGLKESYLDKPVVQEFLDIVETLPRLVLEYVTFISNSTVMSEAVSANGVGLCQVHLYLLEGHRDLLNSTNSTLLPEAIKYLCNLNWELLAYQLAPNSPPYLMNTTIDLDTAVLTSLAESLIQDLKKIHQGQFFRGQPVLPEWLLANKTWIAVFQKISSYADVPLATAIIWVSGANLDSVRTYLDDRYAVTAVAALYQTASRIKSSIDSGTGKIDWITMVNGMGSVQDLVTLIVPLRSTITALFFWYEESRHAEKIARWDTSPAAIYTELCNSDLSQLLYHPNPPLSDEEWSRVQAILCNFTIHELARDAYGAIDVSQIMDGRRIMWEEIAQMITGAAEKAKLIDFKDLWLPLIDNAYMAETHNMTDLQKFVRGWIPQLKNVQLQTIRFLSPEERHYRAKQATILSTLITSLIQPGTPSLLEKLMDVDLFRELLTGIGIFEDDVKLETAKLDYRYHVAAFNKTEALEGLLSEMAGKLNASEHMNMFTEVLEKMTGQYIPKDTFLNALSKLAITPTDQWIPLAKSMNLTQVHLTHLLQYTLAMAPVLSETVTREQIYSTVIDQLRNMSYWDEWNTLGRGIVDFAGVIVPRNFSLYDFVYNNGRYQEAILITVLRGIPDILSLLRDKACQYEDDVCEECVLVGRWAWIILRQTEKWMEYGDLACEIPKTNLTHVFNTLISDFNWITDMKTLLEGKVEVKCGTLFDTFGNISKQVDQTITYYVETPGAWNKIERCLSSTLNSTTMLHLRGLLRAFGGVLGEEEQRANVTQEINSVMSDLPGASTALRTLASRVSVMVPFTEILASGYKSSFSSEVVQVLQSLMVDVNRVYGSEAQELATLMSSKEEMSKWVKVLEDDSTGVRKKRDVQEEERKKRSLEEERGRREKRNTDPDPLDVLYNVIQESGPDTFAEKVLQNINFTYLITEIEVLRVRALVSSNWLDPVLVHMNTAVDTLSTLDDVNAVLDLNKVISGEVDPVTFLSGSLKLMQMKLWHELSKSFSGLLDAGVGLVSGSSLGDDLENVVDGIDALQDTVDAATLDFTMPLPHLVDDWPEVKTYLETDLALNSTVLDAIDSAELNMMALLSLEDTTLQELVCNEGWSRRGLVTLNTTNITSADINKALCNTSNSNALASTFLQHLDLAPVITILTKYGVKSSLSWNNLTLGEVRDAISSINNATGRLPQLLENLRALRLIQDIFPKSQALKLNSSQALRNISSPQFLEDVGNMLCGKPLMKVPDSMGILTSAKRSTSTSRRRGDGSMCSDVYESVRNLPGGDVLVHFIKPLLNGKIFYTPDNAATQTIIKQANETFEVLSRLRESLQYLNMASEWIQPPSNNTNSAMQELEKALELPWLQGLIDQHLQSLSISSTTSTASTSNLTEQIKDTKPQMEEASQLLEEFSEVVDVMVELLSCLGVDRFVGVEDEEQLLKEARKAAVKKDFLAGVVFMNVGDNGDDKETIPNNISYKIRVNVEMSPSTFLLRPRFWRPGPLSDLGANMQYQQGFIQLQDMLERAILKVMYKQEKSATRTRRDTYKHTYKEDLDTYMKHLNTGTRHDKVKRSQLYEMLKRRVKRATGSDGLSADEADWLLNMPVYTKQQPYPCYSKDNFLAMLNESPLMSLIFSFLAFTFFTVFLVKQLVQERESRNRQLQEVMGLRMWVDDLVWFIYASILLVIIAALVSLVIVLGKLQPHTHYGILLAFLLCYGISIIAFCYLISMIVQSTVLAVFVAVMCLLLFNVPFLAISVIPSNTPFSIIRLTCLLPSSAFGFGFRVICQYELQRVGINYDNLWIPPVRDSEMTLGIAIEMLLVDTLIIFIIALLIHIATNLSCRSQKNTAVINVVPSEKEFFLLKNKKDAVHILDLDPGVKQSLKKGVSMKGLRKTYEESGGHKEGKGALGRSAALDNINLDLYEGQVMVMLGHNGAGKTTLISLLTREEEPTTGSIEIYGENILSRTGWERARTMMGVCPQRSILFPLLTVAETLHYYAKLKNTNSKTHATDIDMTLASMGLSDHGNHRAHQLSEGLRRRVCLAVAFVGGSKLVILDEPTSGIDPAARNIIWEVISRHREGRTILLTTHHLDEAETLADRVALLHQGRLLCVGSPLALKSEYGLGYSVTLSRRTPELQQLPNTPPQQNSSVLPDVTSKTGDVKGVLDILHKYVPNARLLETVNEEATFSLPLQDEHGNENRLPEVFGDLEAKLNILGFSSLELRPTSLEDVVIALTTITPDSLKDTALHKEPHNTLNFLPHSLIKETSGENVSLGTERGKQGRRLKLQRLWALLYKRFLHHTRDWKFYVQMFILPFTFMLLSILGSKCRPEYQEAIPLGLNSNTYPAPSSTFIRTLDPLLKPLESEMMRVIVDDDKSGWSECPKPDTYPGFPACRNESLDTSPCYCQKGRCAVNATQQPDMSSWLIHTGWEHLQDRQGGISLGIEDPRLGARGTNGAMIWYDNSAFHALPSLLNMLSNARLHRLLGPNYSLNLVNEPIVFSEYGLRAMTLQRLVADLGMGVLVLVAVTVVCSAGPGYVVTERTTGQRRVMFVAGVSRFVYYAAAMIWDAAILLIDVLLIALLLFVFEENQFIWRQNLLAFVLLTISYGLSILPLFYLVEGNFQSEASAVFTFFCTIFGIGFITSLILVTCQTMFYIKSLNEMGKVIKYAFLIFPPFTYTCGLKDLASLYTRTTIMAQFDIDAYQTPLRWDSKLNGGLGVYFLVLFLWGFLGLVLLCVWPCCKASFCKTSQAKTVAGAEEDKDVAAERVKLQCGGASLYDSMVRLVGVGRDFGSPRITAVSDLYLALARGECFSLLGVNGAGKTTTFRCLTGDLPPSRGQILVDGVTLGEAMKRPRPMMGYCPQSQALDPFLTPNEALYVMALIRGFPRQEIQPVVNRAVQQLDLSDDSERYTCRLSGGNQRKLSTALALLGDPQLVLLDEPTTGMDPASRRAVWSAVRNVTRSGRTVLLTSHSLDEVDQLSHRMGIMVNGQLVCLGSPHYLKQKLGDKYTIRLKTQSIEDLTHVVDFLRSQLTHVLLKEQQHLSLVLEVPRQLPLRAIFDTLTTTRALGVTEFDVSQTTLNQVFRLLTSYQSDGQTLRSPPTTKDDADESEPIHLQNLHPAGHPTHTPTHPIHTPTHHYDIPTHPNQPDTPTHIPNTPKNIPTHPPTISTLAPVENVGRTSFYDNIEVASVSEKSEQSENNESSGTADSSPEEEWTHL